MNILVILAATAIPLVLGFVWYNPKFGFGKAWMASSGMTMEKAKSVNMALVFGLTALFSFMIALAMHSIVLHMVHIKGVLMTQPDFSQPGSHSSEMLKDYMDHYGSSYRTFKHGLFHGLLAGITLALPITGTHALYEGKGFKYIAINAGYFIVSMGLMGGLICALA